MNFVAKSLSEIARSCVGVSRYQLKADPHWAPSVVDCSSFTKWLFGQCGILLPRLAFQQFHACTELVPVEKTVGGELIFRGIGRPRGFYLNCPVLRIDHVGFVTFDRRVVHAANKHVGVIESELVDFFEFKHSGMCAGRII